MLSFSRLINIQFSLASTYRGNDFVQNEEDDGNKSDQELVVDDGEVYKQKRNLKFYILVLVGDLSERNN